MSGEVLPHTVDMFVSGEILPIHENLTSSLHGGHAVLLFALTIVFLVMMFYYLKDVYLK